MAHLKHVGTAPPGGYTYRQKETGLTITSDSFHGLVAKVITHREYRSLPNTDEATVEREIHNQICMRLGTNECTADPGDDWVPIPNNGFIKLADILSFSKTLLEWMSKGLALVPMEEAQRRRAICVACPLNRPATGCRCAVLYQMINACIPKERKFEDLHVCGICRCSLKAKVSVPMEVIEAGEDGRNLKFPVHCWRHKVLPPAQ